MSTVPATHQAQDSADQPDTYSLTGANMPLHRDDSLDVLRAMGIRIFRLKAMFSDFSPSSDYPVDKRLTAPEFWTYNPLTSKEVGIGVPNGAATSRTSCRVSGFFVARIAQFWQSGRGSRKARRCSIGTPTPFRAASHWRGMAVTKPLLEHHMAETTTCAEEIKRLRLAITDIDSLSQSGFSDISAIAKMALLWLEHPDKAKHTDVISQALKLIWYRADDSENSINCEAEQVGCNWAPRTQTAQGATA